MPALTIHPHNAGFTCNYYAPWQWAVHEGTPAQAYGEPYPSPQWILEQTITMYEYRRQQQFKQADALRQWLVDYGMIVENLCNSGVTVKW